MRIRKLFLLVWVCVALSIVTLSTEQAEAVEKIDISRKMTVTATAYCHCYKCTGKSDGITYTGTKAQAGRTIAVDKNVIPLGSEVVINGQAYIAEDTGRVIKGNRIDIYCSNHQQALNFGVKILEIEVLNDVSAGG